MTEQEMKAAAEPPLDCGVRSPADDALIKNLERRIHNQRVALRENWQIVEMRRQEYCGTLRPLRSKWYEFVKKQSAEIRRLKEKCGET